MGYIEQNLISGEMVLYRTRRHWIVLILPVIVAAFFGIPGLMTLVAAMLGDGSGSSSGMGLLFIAAVIFLLGVAHRSSTEMAVTNKRVLTKFGLVSRRATEMMLSKIESITVDQSVLGRILNFGTITVSGTGGTPEPFSRIAHPLEFRRQVQQELDKLESRAAASGSQ